MRNKLILLLFLCLPAFAASRQKAQGYCEQGGQTVVVNVSVTSTGKTQKSYPGCTVSIFDVGTTNLSTIYSDNIGTVKANPFTADITTGLWFFYADDGVYDVRTSGGTGSMSAFTRGGYQLFDRNFTYPGGVQESIKSKLLDWVSVRDFGAVCDGSTDDHIAIQAAISAVTSAGGGTVLIPAKSCSIGTAGITLPLAGVTGSPVHLLGMGRESSVLVYSGTGAAVTMGQAGSITFFTTVEKLTVNTTAAGDNAIGILVFPCEYCTVSLAQMYSERSRSTTRQVGLELRGGNAGTSTFGAFFLWNANYVRGSYYRGVYLSGAELGWGFNSSQFFGGSITNNNSPPTAGTIGYWAKQGNQNVMHDVDVENFDVGIRSDAYDNLFYGSRTEGNNLGVHLTAATIPCCPNPTDTTGGAYNRFYGGSHGDGFTDDTDDTAQVFGTNLANVFTTTLTSSVILKAPLQIPANTAILWQGTGGGSSGLFWKNGTADAVTGIYGDASGILHFQIENVDYLTLNPNETPNRGFEIHKGIYRNGAGFQHFSVPAASICSTAGTVGATCTQPITWNTAWADTNYTPVCSIGKLGSGVPTLMISAFDATSVTIKIIAVTAAAANGAVNCIAVHW